MQQESGVSPDGIALSPGCVLCHQGAKMVLFVTGRCHRTCWYCPLSRERKNLDVVYANDRKISSPADAIAEAEKMSALGTGVTGGEPLLELDRVVEYCRALKERFGPDHQIHLYTALAPNEAMLRRLQGLVDEIRLHPPHEVWPRILETDYARSAVLAREMGFVIGIEVPALPGIGALAAALPLLDFLNINELEWGETCAAAMRERGLELEDGMHNAVLGARRWAEELPRDPKVHFCSSVFKDSVQLRERLKRIAANTARPFEEVTDDGTVVYGVLEPAGAVDEFLEMLDEDDYAVCDGRIEMAWWMLAGDGAALPGRKYVVERYPGGGMVVEVTPL
ncbi:4Fe-4S cluster-binding domain-containing protein [Methanoculleus sp. Wushi-C6]|uniref:4Fe-4S cluster-binding domain-containing protein n=1 Tax=Methanoculleus caldifontis TaxID=2651577 RepID=A0ABU3X3Q9_9EURY|nr:radical SAM protein [Methanoculleus sp. Wushi-C6]MDV2482699.1 4Fe-4S cluster-binding domain-containing protein [Methanoculleus sp. Wushi-C6]